MSKTEHKSGVDFIILLWAILVRGGGVERFLRARGITCLYERVKSEVRQVVFVA